MTEPEEVPKEAEPVVPDDGDDLDAALKEYDEATRDGPSSSIDEALGRWRERTAPDPEPPAEPARPDYTAGKEWLRAQVEAGNIDAMTCANLERALNHQAAVTPVQQELQAAAAQYHAKVDEMDVNATLEKISKDTGIDAAEARRWFTAEAATSPKLRAAWDNRHNGEEGQRAAQAAVSRAVKKMQADMARRPDPELTENRVAVAHAVRAASGRGAPEEDGQAFARRIKGMDDTEFDAFIQGLD